MVLELDVCALHRSCLLLESRLRYLRNDFDQGQIFFQCRILDFLAEMVELPNREVFIRVTRNHID